MALPSTGSISMEQVRTELKRTGTISLNDTDVRKLAGKASGTIGMSDLRGKKNTESVTNYSVFSGSYGNRSSRVKGNFTINFPKKVIKGTLNVHISVNKYGNDRNVYPTVNIGGTSINCVMEKDKAISISNVSSLNCSYDTGVNGTNYGGTASNILSISATFTGEWEA